MLGMDFEEQSLSILRSIATGINTQISREEYKALRKIFSHNETSIQHDLQEHHFDKLQTKRKRSSG